MKTLNLRHAVLYPPTGTYINLSIMHAFIRDKNDYTPHIDRYKPFIQTHLYLCIGTGGCTQATFIYFNIVKNHDALQAES
jgi:hypothetical protein